MKKISVADIHCDLLEYLEGDNSRSPYDEDVLCSFSQLKRGGVVFQVLAVYVSTEADSVKRGSGQVEIFKTLTSKYPTEVCYVKNFDDILGSEKDGKLGIMLALENASGFCSQDEPLDSGLNRLDRIIKDASQVLYISLTHFGENRFGGGNQTQGVALKEDGKELLRHISGKKIAIDLSHASDATAGDILNFIDAQRLSIPVIASHSDFRAVVQIDRNLPDEFAKEIVKRKGLLGINFISDFIGAEGPEYFLRQIEHAIKIGAEENVCFGADFFYPPSSIRKFKMPHDYKFFHDGFDSSACYPGLVDKIRIELGLSEELIQNIAKENVMRYLRDVF